MGITECKSKQFQNIELFTDQSLRLYFMVIIVRDDAD
jgi:hypothetical protein